MSSGQAGAADRDGIAAAQTAVVAVATTRICNTADRPRPQRLRREHLFRAVHLRSVKQIERDGVRAIAGWGQRPSTRLPRVEAAKLGLPFIALEDGFLRSYGTGATHPALSLVVDDQGIYYDATQPSSLESLLASDVDLLSGPGADHARARERILQERLSKYSFAPDLLDLPIQNVARPRVLVVDQTRADASIRPLLPCWTPPGAKTLKRPSTSRPIRKSATVQSGGITQICAQIRA